MVWRKIHQRMASAARVACNPMPATELNVQTARQTRGTVVPISIGFLRQFAATLAAGPARKLILGRRSRDRMILLTFAACLTRRFRFALDRHNSATDISPPSAERRDQPTADATHGAKGGR
jgi:hypothetical protein